MQNKTLGKLGLCRRAGKLVIGAKDVREAILLKRVFLVVLAKDTAENTLRPILRTCEEKNVPVLQTEFSKEEIGASVGYADVAVLGVKDRGFAKSFL